MAINELAIAMRSQFDRQEKKTDKKIDDLAIMIRKQFSHHEKRFDGIDSRFEQMDNRFGQIDSRFEKIEKNMVTKTEFNTAVNSLRSEMNSRFDKLDEEIVDIKIRLGRLEKNLDAEVVAFMDDILDLRKRIVVLEKQIKVLKLAK